MAEEEDQEIGDYTTSEASVIVPPCKLCIENSYHWD